MQTENTTPAPQTPSSKLTPMLRRPAVSLTAAFIAGWLGCLGVVQWRQPAHAQTPEGAKTTMADAERPAIASKHEPDPSTGPTVAAPAAATSPVVAADPAPALAAVPAEPVPVLSERQQERDAVAQLFAKNRENLRTLTSR